MYIEMLIIYAWIPPGNMCLIWQKVWFFCNQSQNMREKKIKLLVSQWHQEYIVFLIYKKHELDDP